MSQTVKENSNNAGGRASAIVIVFLLIVIVGLIAGIFYLYRVAFPSSPKVSVINGQLTENLNPYCLRITCNNPAEPQYYNVVSDPQVNTWVTLNYCSANAPSSGLIESLNICGQAPTSNEYEYWHSTNEEDGSKTNIQVYQEWYQDKFAPNCGNAWDSTRPTPENDSILNSINTCANA